MQAGHAAIDFQHKHPNISKSWWNKSNYLAYLSANDEDHLNRLLLKAESKGISFTVFREPDIQNSITAIALEPGDPARRLTSNLPLAFKNV